MSRRGRRRESSGRGVDPAAWSRGRKGERGNKKTHLLERGEEGEKTGEEEPGEEAESKHVGAEEPGGKKEGGKGRWTKRGHGEELRGRPARARGERAREREREREGERREGGNGREPLASGLPGAAPSPPLPCFPAERIRGRPRPARGGQPRRPPGCKPGGPMFKRACVRASRRRVWREEWGGRGQGGARATKATHEREMLAVIAPAAPEGVRVQANEE